MSMFSLPSVDYQTLNGIPPVDLPANVRVSLTPVRRANQDRKGDRRSAVRARPASTPGVLLPALEIPP